MGFIACKGSDERKKDSVTVTANDGIFNSSQVAKDWNFIKTTVQLAMAAIAGFRGWNGPDGWTLYYQMERSIAWGIVYTYSEYDAQKQIRNHWAMIHTQHWSHLCWMRMDSHRARHRFLQTLLHWIICWWEHHLLQQGVVCGLLLLHMISHNLLLKPSGCSTAETTEVPIIHHLIRLLQPM